MMPLFPRFALSPDVAAETGIHIGDGSLSIKRKGPHGSYQYEVTGHALEDQLYLIGTVMRQSLLRTASNDLGSTSTLNGPGFP